VNLHEKELGLSGRLFFHRKTDHLETQESRKQETRNDRRGPAVEEGDGDHEVNDFHEIKDSRIREQKAGAFHQASTNRHGPGRDRPSCGFEFHGGY